MAMRTLPAQLGVAAASTDVGEVAGGLDMDR